MTLKPFSLSKLDKQSPNTAPLPWPTCKGPVGLADTNSTSIFDLIPELFLPKLFFSFKILFIVSNFLIFEIKKFIKPGPAISIFAILSFSLILLIMFSANFLGFSLNLLAYFIAIFDEKSPNFLSLHKFTSISFVE